MKKAVVVDLDGSLVNVDSILHHIVKDHPKNETGKRDYKSFHQESINCPANPTVMEYIEFKQAEGYTLVVVTGRSDEYKSHTVAWLEDNMEIPYDGPYMRPSGDHRKATVVKKEILSSLEEKYDFHYAVEDDPEVVSMLEEDGIEVKVVERTFIPS